MKLQGRYKKGPFLRYAVISQAFLKEKPTAPKQDVV